MLEGSQAGAERLRLVGPGAAALLEPADSRLEELELRRRGSRIARGKVTLALGQYCLLLGERIAPGSQFVLCTDERLLCLTQLRQPCLDPLDLVRGGGRLGGFDRRRRLLLGLAHSLLPNVKLRGPRLQFRGSRCERGLALCDRARALRELGLTGVEARRARVELVGDGSFR